MSARYCHKRLRSPRAFAPGSFRTIKRGSKGVKMVVGCPKGKYKRGRCAVGMRAQAILRPRGRKACCPIGYKIGRKGGRCAA